MIDALLVVLSRPLDNRHDAFNDWYSKIHIRDVMRFRGGIAACRFRLNPHRPAGYNNPLGWHYLALYEVSDTGRFIQEHIEAIGTARMDISDSFDASIVDSYHYYPLAFRDADPALAADGGVVMEQIKTRPGQEQAFADWYEAEYMPGAARRPGVKSATLLAYQPRGQMMPTDPEVNFVAVYRLSDAAAMVGWDSNPALLACPHIELAKLAVSAWDPIGVRLTKDAVLYPTAASLASEEQARAAMGGAKQRSTGAELAAR